MKHHDCRVTTWGCIRRATTLSVLALTVASSSAADHTEIAHDIASKSTPSATGLLDGRESHSNRPFFIQDPTDGLCLSGGTFKRCAVDTLWKVEGEAGRQAVRRVAVQEDGGYCFCCIGCCTCISFLCGISVPRPLYLPPLADAQSARVESISGRSYRGCRQTIQACWVSSLVYSVPIQLRPVRCTYDWEG